MLINGIDTASYSSRGQARTLALALRLSEAAYLTSVKGEPIILLDDVLSELDEHRRRQVLGRVQNFRQTFITTTDLAPFEPAFLSRATIYGISNATVQVIKGPEQPMSEEVESRLRLFIAPDS